MSHPTPEPTPDPRARRDVERLEPVTRLDEVRGPLNVVAAYRGVGHARIVIEALEAAGIDGSDISLLGAQPAEGGDEVAPASREKPVRRVASRAAVGGVIGGIIGVGAGLVLLGGMIDPVPAGIAGGVLGSGAGAMISGAANIGMASAWRQTFTRLRTGNVAVGVHTTSRTVADRAASIMDSYAPLAVNRFEGS